MTQAQLDKAYRLALEQCTESQQLFVREYLVDLQKGAAYMRAYPGTTKENAGPAATRLALKAQVDTAVKAGMAARGHKLDLTTDKVLEELMRLGFANLADYLVVQSDGSAVVDLSELTRDQAAAISEITVDEYLDGKGEDAREVKRTKIKLVDKGQNLERLGRYLKLFTDRVEVSGLEQLAERIRQARENFDGPDDGSDLAG
jgi:phage terminase small subunit